MHGESLPSSVDAAIAARAADQYGLITRAQLVELGLRRGAIEHRLLIGRLHRLHVGVYAVGHAAERQETRWLAAVLACGDGAVLSHRSAATLWRIRLGEGPRPDVTVPRERRCERAEIAAHQGRLTSADVTEHLGIPVTTPARTLVDLAHVLDEDDLVRALRETQFLRRFDLAATRKALERRPSRRLSRLLDRLAVTQSGLEDAMLVLCDRLRMPRPLTQQHVLGQRVDFLWPREKVIVETDGWRAHGTASAFQRDRTATNALLVAGYVVLRFTHADVMHRSAQVARQIMATLTARDSAA
jgi:very-short-patch-repair endonuclease